MKRPSSKLTVSQIKRDLRDALATPPNPRRRTRLHHVDANENPMIDLFNKWDIQDGTAPVEVMVAYDAIGSGHKDIAKLLVGLPATVSVGSDSYAAEIVKATPKTITAETEDGEQDTFRHTKNGWLSKRKRRLSVGKAEHHRDPSF